MLTLLLYKVSTILSCKEKNGSVEIASSAIMAQYFENSFKFRVLAKLTKCCLAIPT